MQIDLNIKDLTNKLDIKDIKYKIKEIGTTLVTFNIKNAFIKVFFREYDFDFVIRYNSTVKSGVKTFKITNCKNLSDLKMYLIKNKLDIENGKKVTDGKVSLLNTSKDGVTKYKIFSTLINLIEGNSID